MENGQEIKVDMDMMEEKTIEEEKGMKEGKKKGKGKGRKKKKKKERIGEKRRRKEEEEIEQIDVQWEH